MIRRFALVFLVLTLPQPCFASPDSTGITLPPTWDAGCSVDQIVEYFKLAKKLSDKAPPCVFTGTIKERSTVLGNSDIRMWNLRIQVEEVLCGSVSDSVDILAPCYYYFDRGKYLTNEWEMVKMPGAPKPVGVQRIHPLNGEGISTVEPEEIQQHDPQAEVRDRIHPIYLPGDRVFMIGYFRDQTWHRIYSRFLLNMSETLSAQTTDNLDWDVLRASEEAGTIPPDSAFVRREFSPTRVRLANVRPALQNKCEPKKH